MACEEERTRLIGQIASLLRESSVPAEARAAGLTLIGWLARRMPGEPVSLAGVEEMLRRCAEYGHTQNGNAAEESNGAVAYGSTGTNGASVSTNGASSSAKGRVTDKRGGAARSNGRRGR